ncbi:hypothetical protein EPH95_02700 [Salicibibacter halophilus]|uniref:HK97 gp10 family phage protein n=1 Tax=Salicibibacter halophilus TaxID=2502791 RepID=A0A514LED4_9BACI|nr:HK97-gp10 family putative phage morphogenesis protein [Salicibibacter halophilus]QDI90213.1 hypothetical protein EPH95_02700 [Salicibibacter halophilus]
MADMKLNGMQELDRALGRRARNANRDVKNIVRRRGASLDRRMKQNATFAGKYTTGATRRSIRLTMSDAGFTATVAPRTNYASYVEWGTRFAAAQPFVRPAFYAERAQFLRDIQNLVR